jgi:hypothetical protein
MLQTLILYIVVFQGSTLYKAHYIFSKSSTIHDLIDNMNN